MELFNYLFFTTQCEDALDFYSSCGLGEIVELRRYGEDGSPKGNPAMLGLVMHAKFSGPGITFFASDNDDAEPMRGSAHMLLMDSRDETELLFSKMSDGGKVTTPLGIQPWGSFYGKLTDKFGVQWMLDCAR